MLRAHIPIAIIVTLFLLTFSWSLITARLERNTCEDELAKCRASVEACQRDLRSASVKEKPTELVYRLAVKKSKRYVPLRFVKEMVETAMRYDDGVLLVALITVESHFDPFDVSPSGAVGCGQVKQSVWGKFLKEKGVIQSPRDYRDPVKCVEAAATVLGHLLTKANGDITKALAYYQCGESDKKCHRTTGIKYARDVMKEYGYYLYEVNRLRRESHDPKTVTDRATQS